MISGQAFCGAHGEVINQLGYPTALRDFLKSCSSVDAPVDPFNYTKSMKLKVEELKKHSEDDHKLPLLKYCSLMYPFFRS